MKDKGFRSTCAISSTLDIIGDKWSLLLIRDLLYFGTRTFKEFSQSEERISTAALSERLKRLETWGILIKENHPTNRKVFLYKLTQKGKDLAPIVVDCIIWGNQYLGYHTSDESKAFARKLKQDREGVLEELMSV